MTESIDFELGINTFLETSPDPVTGKRISHSERIRNGIEEIVVADQVGLDVFGIGEHQRFDFASEAPAVILAAAAALTKRIRLTSAYVGDPEYVAEKILLVRKKLGTNRFFLHLNIGTLPHREVLRAIEMFGTRVAPIVRKEIAKENKQTTV